MSNQALDYLDEALSIIEQHALNRDRLDWPAILPTAKVSA